MISMKNVRIENRLSRRYVAKQMNADILLHHYYTKQIFRVWKREYRGLKKLSTCVRGRLLSKVLTEWQRYSNGRAHKKAQIKDLTFDVSLKVKAKVFTALNEWRLDGHTEKRKYRQV